MKFTLKGTHLDLSESIKAYFDQKIVKSLEKRLLEFSKQDAVTVDCELSRDTKHHHKGEVFRAEVNILIPPRKMLRAEARATDIRSAIDLLEEALTRKLELYKGKTRMNVRRAARKNKNVFYFNEKNY
jgi:ribosomal subunit interface protein